MIQKRTLPFRYSDVELPMKRLIIEPTKIAEEITESGLKIPSREHQDSEVGVVYATDAESDFKVGDEVQYKKVDRASNEHIESVSIDGKVYDVVYEYKIACVNGRPYSQIFVNPLLDSELLESGLVIPADVQSITRKGIVFDAPDYFTLKKGDVIEYYNQLTGYYPQVNIDGEVYECLQEEVVFMVNGKVAPHRIIVKIDLVAQHIKRSSTHSGLKLSPLFIAMLRNLQYAEISDIGEEAQKKYPELSKGDTIIIDHAVESQDYRIIDVQKGKQEKAIYEHRIINCYDFSEREIFGKLKYDKSNNKIIDITPIGDSVFMKWEFEHFEHNLLTTDLMLPDDTLSQYKNLSDLKHVVDHKRKEAAELAKLRMSGIKQAMSRIKPDEDPRQWEVLAKELGLMEREEKRKSAELRKDFWVVCQTIFPRQDPAYIISPYEEIYPINIMGNKFLIGHSDFLLFKTHTNMNITPKDMVALSDNVLVLPIEEKTEGALIIPDAAKQKPQYGQVVRIGENKDGIKDGDFILYRQFAGLQQEIGGVQHLVMKHNDLLFVVPEKPSEAEATA